jgi:hypothetical protein
VQPQSDYSDEFFSGLYFEGWVRWRLAGDKWGYLDRTGSVAVPPRYDCTWDFSEGLARVQVGEEWGFIGKTGSMVIQPKPYSVVTDFSGDLASAITQDGEEVYFDRTAHMCGRQSEGFQQQAA